MNHDESHPTIDDEPAGRVRRRIAELGGLPAPDGCAPAQPTHLRVRSAVRAGIGAHPHAPSIGAHPHAP